MGQSLQGRGPRKGWLYTKVQGVHFRKRGAYEGLAIVKGKNPRMLVQAGSMPRWCTGRASGKILRVYKK